jgi:hypothetical protein
MFRSEKMGLDCYLSASRYISEYSEVDQELDKNINSDTIKSLLPAGVRIEKIKVEAAYWRKANAIHNWFVQYIQDGIDDCKEYDVSRKQLKQLYDTCKEVLADRSSAEDLLPSASGFFFGTTEYDNWYFEILEQTVEKLEPLIDDSDESPWHRRWYFTYQSSW